MLSLFVTALGWCVLVVVCGCVWCELGVECGSVLAAVGWCCTLAARPLRGMGEPRFPTCPLLILMVGVSLSLCLGGSLACFARPAFRSPPRLSRLVAGAGT